MFAWLILPLFALAVLGAHFMRAGAWPLVLACVGLVLLMAWPRRWAARTVQAALALGAAEWLWTLALLAQQRIALGQPWLRMALILGGVALFTAGAALVFQRRSLRLRYGLDRKGSAA